MHHSILLLNLTSTQLILRSSAGIIATAVGTATVGAEAVVITAAAVPGVARGAFAVLVQVVEVVTVGAAAPGACAISVLAAVNGGTEDVALA